MAAFPNWVKYDWRDMSEKPESVIERSEMERGIPKQTRKVSDARVELEMTLHFDTKAEVDAFEDWFYEVINAGQDWFDFLHPRRGVVVQARVVGGELGVLKALQPTLQANTRTMKIEHWRSTW